MQFSPDLKRVLGVALEGMSDPLVARRLAERQQPLSHNTVNYLRKGYYGRAETVATLGRGISDLLLRHYRQEIEREQGAASDDAAALWLRSLTLRSASAAEDGDQQLSNREVLDELRRTREELTARLDQMFGKQERPWDRLVRLYGELVRELQPQGYTVPPLSAAYSGGVESLTDEDVEIELESYRQRAIQGGKQQK